MPGNPRVPIKEAFLNPSAVALDSCEVRGTETRSIDTVNRALVADVIYDDFIGANGFERSLTVIIHRTFNDECGDLVNVGLRKLIGIRPYDFKLSALSGASRNDNQGGANYEARHRPNEKDISHGRVPWQTHWTHLAIGPPAAFLRLRWLASSIG
jgi:hypothetical protein